MSSWLRHHRRLVAGRSVVELGCGCGFVGISIFADADAATEGVETAGAATANAAMTDATTADEATADSATTDAAMADAALADPATADVKTKYGAREYKPMRNAAPSKYVFTDLDPKVLREEEEVNLSERER